MKLPNNCPEEVMLYSKQYLQEHDIEQWSLVNLDMALVTTLPGITKHVAHKYIVHDLDILSKLYPENKAIGDRINSIRKELKKSKQEANQALSEFWNKEVTRFEKSLIKGKASKLEAEAGSLDLAASIMEDLARRKRALPTEEPSLSSTSPPPTKSRRMKTRSEDIKEVVETDNIYLKPGGFSVGTIIKQHAILVHEDYKKGEKISYRRRKVMVAGLSSILDLSDGSIESQRSLFPGGQWQLLVDFFRKKFPLPSIELPEYLDDAITIISNTCNDSIEMGFKYLYKLYGKAKIDKNKRSMLQILEHCLEIMDDYGHLLNKAPNKTSYTEQDYLTALWSRVFALLFKSNKNIRIKSGESISPIGTANKQNQYPSASNVVGFKVDGRLVVDVDNTEYDLWAVEVAKDDADPKLIEDLGKLIREGKDNTDELYTTLAQDNIDDEKMTWLVQISGANCQFSSVHLASDGLYVILKRLNFSLPSSIDNFRQFGDTLKMLLSIKACTTKMADRLTNAAQKRNDIVVQLVNSQRPDWMSDCIG